MFLSGKFTLDLGSQGTLVECQCTIRAHAAGITASFTLTGAAATVEERTISQRCKEGGAANCIEINGNDMFWKREMLPS